jgi:gas vesicle protein
MDWLKQSEEMIKMWSDTQQKMLSSWLGSMQSFTGQQSEGVWTKTLDAWEQAVNNMLETQAQWARLWAGSVTATKGTPKQAVDSANQFKEMTERWAQFQKELWQSWFETIRKFAPNAGTETPQDAFKLWQDTLQKAMDSQLAWMRSWTTKA